MTKKSATPGLWTIEIVMNSGQLIRIQMQDQVQVRDYFTELRSTSIFRGAFIKTIELKEPGQ